MRNAPSQLSHSLWRGFRWARSEGRRGETIPVGIEVDCAAKASRRDSNEPTPRRHRRRHQRLRADPRDRDGGAARVRASGGAEARRMRGGDRHPRSHGAAPVQDARRRAPGGPRVREHSDGARRGGRRHVRPAVGRRARARGQAVGLRALQQRQSRRGRSHSLFHAGAGAGRTGSRRPGDASGTAQRRADGAGARVRQEPTGDLGSVPVHPHFGDLAVLGLAEDGPAGVHPFAAAAPTVGATKLGREPGAGDVQLSGLEGHVGLVLGNVLPIRADRVNAGALGAERGFEEDGIGGEDGGDLIYSAALPPAAKRIQQLAIGLGHGANIREIWNCRSGRMVDGSSRGSLPRFSQAFSYRLQEDETMMKRILATTAVLACCALPLAAQAHEKMAGDEMTITAQVVDLNCNTTNGASGAGHKACAQACAKAGVPLGLLSSDGTMYLPVSSKPGDPQNSKLIPFAESKVKVTGTRSEEHTSELQSRLHLVCRLLLEKKKKKTRTSCEARQQDITQI